MKEKILLFILVAFFLSNLWAEETTSLVQAISVPASGVILPSDPMQARISLDLRNIEIVEALKFLSVKTGLSIVPTQKVSGRVTLMVENVPIKDVFDIMLRSNNLAYDKKGEIYNVMTEAEYKA
ncbi:MAG: secretin and TonB N-terminal domain-containing protein, partial [Candidatus Omnitrophica bacterium]|nr:secretin and TonB N-terminal domain-containing protein [Candidatus Omnitrophota bacterium]